MQQREGYKIRVNSSSILEITGHPVELPMNIDIEKGSNLISFPFQGSVNAMNVVQSLIDAGILEKIQDEQGNSIEYWGSSIGWINGIGNFKEGEGYLLQSSNSGLLTINKMYEKSNSIQPSKIETTNFQVAFEGNGSSHMNINIVGLNESNLQVGDEIAAFDGDICVGTVKLSEINYYSNAVSIIASNSDDDIDNGFVEGNPIELRVWKANTNKETSNKPAVINGDLYYKKKSSVFLQLKNPEEPGFETIEIDIYPNPARENFTKRFSGIPEGKTTIIISDMTGKLLTTREVYSTHEVFDIQSYPPGMYIVKTVVGDNHIVNKLIKR